MRKVPGEAVSTYTDTVRRYYETHKAQFREYANGMRQLRRKLHICIDCGTQDAYTLNGRTYCADCAAKDAERHRKKYVSKRPRKEKPAEKPYVNYPRGDNGICWQCNKLPVMDGRRLCPGCYEKKVAVALENLKHVNREKHPWRRL